MVASTHRVKLLPAIGLILGLLIVLSPVATAHANLKSSEPSAGSRLDLPPSRAVVVLTERIDPAGSGLEVIDVSGNRVDDHNVKIDNQDHPVFEVGLPTDLPPGAYSIRWFALSSVDQHTTSGTVGFAVGGYAPPTSTASAVDEFDPTTMAARFLVYAGFCAAFAGALFAFWIDPKAVANRREELYLKMMRVGAFSHVVGVGLLAYHTWRSTGVELQPFLGGVVGGLLGLRLLAGILAVGLLLVPTNVWSRFTQAGVASLLLAALGSARFGHASTMGPAAIGTQFLHLLSIASWVGCLIVYVWLLLRNQIWSVDPWTARNLGHRFSIVAMTAVIVMAVTGVLLSYWILGLERILHPLDTARSTYGRVLLGKVLLAAAMVSVASVNRYVFLAHENDWKPMKMYQATVGKLSGGRFAPLEHGSSQNVFRGLVTGEAVMGFCVLLLAAFLTTLGAPYAAVAAQPLHIQAAGDSFRADVFFEPAPVAGGFSDVAFYLNDTMDGEPMHENSCGRESCVTLFLMLEGAPDNASEARPAELVDDGGWLVSDLLFVQPGNYTIVINVQTANVFLDRIEFDLVVDAT